MTTAPLKPLLSTPVRLGAALAVALASTFTTLAGAHESDHAVRLASGRMELQRTQVTLPSVVVVGRRGTTAG